VILCVYMHQVPMRVFVRYGEQEVFRCHQLTSIVSHDLYHLYSCVHVFEIQCYPQVTIWEHTVVKDGLSYDSLINRIGQVVFVNSTTSARNYCYASVPPSQTVITFSVANTYRSCSRTLQILTVPARELYVFVLRVNYNNTIGCHCQLASLNVALYLFLRWLQPRGSWEQASFDPAPTALMCHSTYLLASAYA
jgi:hypothetical protein